MSSLPNTSMTLVEKINGHSITEEEWRSRYVPRYYGPIVDYAEKILKDRKNAGCAIDGADVVTCVLDRLWKYLSSEESNERKKRERTGSLRRWIETTVYRKIGDVEKIESRRKHPESQGRDSDDGDQPEKITPLDTGGDDDVAIGESERRINAIVLTPFDWVEAFWNSAKKYVYTRSHISKTYREIITKVIFEGKRAVDVANEYGIDQNNVCQIKSRFLSAVRGHLEELKQDQFLFDKELFHELESRHLKSSAED